MRTLGLGCWLLLAVPGAWAQEPAWQRAAGEAMAFEVATVRPSAPGTFTPPSFALSSDDSFTNTGGEFVADFPIGVYLTFAYKLAISPEQTKLMNAQIPKDVADARFTVHAKGPATATKDQMRLMVQDLLRERFGLKAHLENHEAAVLELMTAKSEVTGPKLRPHSEGPKCVEEGGPAVAEGVFPPVCGAYMSRLTPERQTLMGSRNTTLELMAAQMFPYARLGKTVVDRTGLSGRWDFTLEFVPEAPPGAPPPPPGLTFLEAVEDQLGLKLKPGKASLQVLVVEHVEMPSGN